MQANVGTCPQTNPEPLINRDAEGVQVFLSANQRLIGELLLVHMSRRFEFV